jgi:hypothetical protein
LFKPWGFLLAERERRRKTMKIISNGSRWAREAPDSVEKLIDVLGHHKLESTWKRNGQFFNKIGDDEFQAFGNFTDLSHVFDIRGSLNKRRFGIR